MPVHQSSMIIVAVCSVLCSATWINAAPKGPTSELLSFYFDKKYAQDDRIRLNRLFANYCRSQGDATPTNTPAEETWITTESATTDISRITRLIQSQEWARHQIKELFSECLIIVAALERVQAQNSFGEESEFFIRLALTFNSSDLPVFAKRVGLVKTSEDSLAVTGDYFRRMLLFAALSSLEQRGRDRP